MSFDEVCFQRIEVEISDYDLSDLIIPPHTSLAKLIEYCVKLLLKEDVILCPGYEDTFETACVIKKGIQNTAFHVKKMKIFL